MADQILQWSLMATAVMMTIAIVIVTFCLLRGPTLPDRVVALDLIGTLTAGAIGVFAMSQNEPVYILVSVVLSVVLFVGTVAFAYYIEKGLEQ